MRLLFDECLPKGLKTYFPEHDCRTVPEMGWSGLKNSELLINANGLFDVLITIDQGIFFQQHIGESKLALLLFSAPSNRLEDLVTKVPAAREALKSITAGQIIRA